MFAIDNDDNSPSHDLIFQTVILSLFSSSP